MNEARASAARERPLRPWGPPQAGPAATNCEPLAGSSETCALRASVARAPFVETQGVLSCETG
jgi:hypothetical protein